MNFTLLKYYGIIYKQKEAKYMKEYYIIQNSSTIYELVRINKNTATLKANNIVVKTDIQNISKIDYTPQNSKKKNGCSVELSTQVPDNTLMLRHLTRSEALEELDRFMDKAIAHHLPQVTIIHGRHGNVLRNAVREYLSSCPYVISYEYADLAHGSVGATVAMLGKK